MLPARMCYLLTARYHTQKVSRRIDFSTKCPACHAGSQRLRENVRCGRELLTGERSRAHVSNRRWSKCYVVRNWHRGVGQPVTALRYIG